jgi:glycosyltransferase involved in cell wall biosynthesis
VRLLFVHHVPWERELGGARVHIELGEELARQGHEIDHYCHAEAFGPGPRSRLGELIGPRFSRRARRYVSARASHYDVIDAREGDLPFSKSSLRFEGLLVARSVGLSHAYRDFIDFAVERWPDQDKGRWPGRVARFLQARRKWPDFERSWRGADLLNLPNEDELRFLDSELRGKAVVLPYGLSRQQHASLAEHAASPSDRLARREVVFIGYWSPRKGSRDLGGIIRHVRELAPDTRFLLLGTRVPNEQVLRDLGEPAADWIRIVPRFSAEELPRLLSLATVGVFPSYVEGLGIAVVEQLAAGLPTVAYDVAGPRAILGEFRRQLTVRPGEARAFAEVVARLLLSDERHYACLSECCRERALAFSWDSIARQTIATYARRLEALS